MITIIAATDPSGGIGINNRLPWNIPEEMEVFKNETWREYVIMGRRTFESIGSRPLKSRHNFVVTRTPGDIPLIDTPDTTCVGIDLSVERIVALAKDPRSFFVIGGENIYRQFLPYASTVILSTIRKNYNCDSFFPSVFSSAAFTNGVQATPWKIQVLRDNKKFVTHRMSRTINKYPILTKGNNMAIQLITPEEASERTVRNLEQLVNDALFKIDTLIRKEADAGNFSLNFDFRTVNLGDDHQTAVDTVKSSLIEEGFAVEVQSQFNRGGTIFQTISVGWEIEEPDVDDNDGDEEPDP